MRLQNNIAPGIRNIIFDIGNVLIDLDIPATLKAFNRLRIGGLRPEDIHPYQTGFFLDYELGQIDDDGFTGALRETYDCSGVTDAQIFAAWNAMLTPPDPVRFNIIRQLRHHYRLFVLSNTNPQHIKHLREQFRTVCGGEFDALFERCFYSHEMHLRKPDTEIYRQVVAQAGIVPEETLFIDDNACNFSGAEPVDLKTYHLTGGESIDKLFK